MAAGLPPAEFWIQTPGLYALHLRGVAAAEERRAMEIRSAAYLTALLIRQQPLPPALPIVMLPRATLNESTVGDAL